MISQNKNNSEVSTQKKHDLFPPSIFIILILLMGIIGGYRVVSESNAVKMKEVKKQIPEVKQQLLPSKH